VNQAVQPVGPVARAVLATTGVLFVGIGAVGAMVPGIPTVGPLLLASYCFSRSFPWLERRLIRNRFFGRFLVYVDNPRTLPLRIRLTGLAMMWLSISISLTTLWLSGGLNVWLLVGIPAAGVIGTFFIMRGVRESTGPGQPAAPSPSAEGTSGQRWDR
jgi:uncharacterized membrane protein YbaN (DUF454 family)